MGTFQNFSVCAAIIGAWLSTGSIASAAIDCAELRPMRALSQTEQTNIEAGASIISKKLAGGDVKFNREFSYKEYFPEFLSTNDLFEIERFYYMACLALSDERFDPAERFQLLMQAQRERSSTMSNAVDESFSSGQTSESIRSLEQAMEFGGNLQRIAITNGLKSQDTAVRGAALRSIVASSSVITGIWGKDTPFGIKIEKTTYTGSVLNIEGTFYGGPFARFKDDQSDPFEAFGTVTGESLYFSNDICTLQARVTTEQSLQILKGEMGCRRHPYGYSGEIRISLM